MDYIDDMDRITQQRIELEKHIGDYLSVVVGFSAGVDSSVVAAAAYAALGNNALAVTAITETITDEDVQLADDIAKRIGIQHAVIRYSELEIEHFADNPSNRCYYCKDGLYTRLRQLADDRGIAHVLDGTNADDVSDYRPGRQAAGEQGVRSPLLELGISKADTRLLAEAYGLPNSSKPSAPCLSSRVPYGTKITSAILSQISAAERALRALGFTELRVRHHNEVARVEIPPSDFQYAIQCAASISAALKATGYQYVALDLAGFRSGSLNESLTQIELPHHRDSVSLVP